MNILESHITNYLEFCKSQKRLDAKTLKAYKIDLTQFAKILNFQDISNITVDTLESFIAYLHQNFKPKTAKRKIASVKAFYHYLEYKDIIPINPFNKMQLLSFLFSLNLFLKFFYIITTHVYPELFWLLGQFEPY